MKRVLKISLTAFITVFILLGSAMPVNMVGNWYQQLMPNIGTKQITDITFIDSLTGFAIASRNVNPDTSSILKTTNGGDSWLAIFTQTPRRFSRIKFVNSLTGFISGGSGSGTPYLYKSTDGGNSWNTVPGATLGTSFWNDMSVLNENTIWLVDANSLNGGVYYSSNGGANWQQQLNLGSSNPEKIYMFNARIGFISKNQGSLGYVRKTTNGGINWDTIVNNDYFLDIYFTDSLVGWKSSAFGFKKTSNGGLNWVTQTLPSGGFIQTNGGLSFSNINKDTIWSSGGYLLYPNNTVHGFLNRTTNGGDTWYYQIPDTSFQYVGGFVNFVDKLHGWSTSTYGGIHTTTGGDTIFLLGLTQISNEMPNEFKLYQNFPNPFNPVTNIKYEITTSKYVNLIVYDITGKQIIDLVNRKQETGTYQVEFIGNGYSSGVYFYSLIVDSKIIATKKMLMIK